MPIISLFKRLVGGGSDDSGPAPVAMPPAIEPAVCEIQAAGADDNNGDDGSESGSVAPKRMPLPPPPISKAFSSAGVSATQSTASMASLRSQVESERKSAGSAAAYRDFTGGGHAGGGHWNDPPTVVFKAQQSPATTAAVSSSASSVAVKRKPIGGSVSPSSKASSFVMVDESATALDKEKDDIEEQLPQTPTSSGVPEDRTEQEKMARLLLRKALESVPLDSAALPMTRRMVDDTAKRLALLEERLPVLDATVVHSVCSIAVLIECGKLAEALAAHRDLMQAGFDSELKWLVGVKRVIELQQKSNSAVSH
ncbi:hypothetical protein GGI20_000974 [Coemansia sp. BCRC 34301]|nr:hypothetical protein GGI20_000974 [Coemansia sp. BCRC 34301]